FINTAAFSPDGKHLAAACADRNVYIFEVETGKQFHRLGGHSLLVYGVAYSPDGHWLASVSGDRTTRLLDVRKGYQLQSSYPTHTLTVRQVIFTPDSKGIITCGADNVAKITHVGTPTERLRFAGHTDA